MNTLMNTYLIAFPFVFILRDRMIIHFYLTVSSAVLGVQKRSRCAVSWIAEVSEEDFFLEIFKSFELFEAFGFTKYQLWALYSFRLSYWLHFVLKPQEHLRFNTLLKVNHYVKLIFVVLNLNIYAPFKNNSVIHLRLISIKISPVTSILSESFNFFLVTFNSHILHSCDNTR